MTCAEFALVATTIFFQPGSRKNGLPDGSDGKASVSNAGDPGLNPGSGRSPGEGNCNPLQYSCLENPMDRGAWWATVHGVAKSRTRLSNFTYSSKEENEACFSDDNYFAWGGE